MNLSKLSIDDYSQVLNEVEYIKQKHRSLLIDIDTTKGNDESVKEICLLQQVIEKRTEELKKFIERYSFDNRISFFIKANKSLNKLLDICKVRTITATESNTCNDNKSLTVSKPTISNTKNDKGKSQITKTKSNELKEDSEFNEIKEIIFKIKLSPEEFKLYENEKKRFNSKEGSNNI